MQSFWIKALLRFGAKLPLSYNHALGRYVGNRLWKKQRGEYQTSLKNIQACFPKLEQNQQQQLVKRSLIETGKTFTESGLLWFGGKKKFFQLVQEVHGEELLQQGLEKGNGVILAIPHLGNWEAIGLYCSASYPMTSLYRPPRMAGLDDLIRNARQQFGAKLVPTNAKGVRALYQALASNELVAILPDQDPRESGGEFAPFFGIETNTMTLLSRLVQKTGATVLCTYAERLSDSRGYAIHFRQAPDEIYSPDNAVSIAALNEMVESAIRQLPEQYQWSYKRFRTRPEGEMDFYL